MMYPRREAVRALNIASVTWMRIAATAVTAALHHAVVCNLINVQTYRRANPRHSPIP